MSSLPKSNCSSNNSLPNLPLPNRTKSTSRQKFWKIDTEPQILPSWTNFLSAEWQQPRLHLHKRIDGILTKRIGNNYDAAIYLAWINEDNEKCLNIPFSRREINLVLNFVNFLSPPLFCSVLVACQGTQRGTSCCLNYKAGSVGSH